MELYYNRPAQSWNEALPVGNGRLGCMVFGGVGHETLMLNEDTLWSGFPQSEVNPKARAALPDIRQLVKDKRYAEADKRSRDLMGAYTESYLPLGNLEVDFFHGHSFQDYRRSLDISRALAAVRYRIGRVRYEREFSFPLRAGFCLQDSARILPVKSASSIAFESARF